MKFVTAAANEEDLIESFKAMTVREKVMRYVEF